MEAQPDFDPREVARTVALAVSSLHNRTLSSSDSYNDETPLVSDTKEQMDQPTGSDVADDRCLYKEKKTTGIKKYVSGMPARYVLTLMGFLGFCNVYALRVNLSVALVAMVKSPENHSTIDACPVLSNSSKPKEEEDGGQFPWTPETQAMILGSFFYGYVVTQLPAGRMAEIFGGKWLFGIGVLCTSIFTLLTPVAARWHVNALVTLRVLEGLGEGVTFPAMHSMLGRWLPKFERSLLSTIIYSGAQIGTVVSMPVSGWLCSSAIMGGWPSVFYLFGSLGCVWFIFWILLIYDNPEDHPRISPQEILFIQSETQIDEPSAAKPAIPWRMILTSVPVWALVFTHFGQNWGFYTLLTELPTYLSVILHFDIKSNGLISALPYLLQAIASWVISYIADRIRQKRIATVSTIRKVCNSVGFFGPAVCFVGVALSGCSSTLAVLFLTLAMGLNGATYSGFMVTHVDMSPTFAGTLMGMTNGVANLAGIMAPAAVGALTEDNQSLHQWQIVFYIAMASYIAAGILFIVCGSAQLQPWDPSHAGSGITNDGMEKEKTGKTVD